MRYLTNLFFLSEGGIVMLRILNKSGKDPQKKLISFQNSGLIDGMIKAEAASYNTSDSFIVEKTMIEHYLNPNDNIASAIASNLFKDNGIVLSLKAINQIYIAHPEYANDSLINVLKFAARLAQEYPVSLKINDDGVKELADMASEMETIIKKTVDADSAYSFLSVDGNSFRHVDSFDLIALHDVSEAATQQRKLDMVNLIYLGIESILTFWNFGGDSDSASLKNWKGTFLFLDKILNLSEWPDYPAYKFEYSQLVKEITLDKGDKGIYTSVEPILSKVVFLDKKSFVTTEDAVILHSETGQDDRYYTGAYRIIHGPGSPMTKKPYIILYRNESENKLNAIVEKLVKDYPDEFPDSHDSYLAQFMWNGAYFDNRIRWKTV